MGMNNVTYPNYHYILYNGNNLTYTNEPIGKFSFAEMVSFTAQQNVPKTDENKFEDGLNTISTVFDTRSLQGTQMEQNSTSYLCSAGEGPVACNSTFTRTETIVKYTDADGMMPKSLGQSYNLPM